jgi:hypothetical protein
VPVLNVPCEDDIIRSVDTRGGLDPSILQREDVKPYSFTTVFGSTSQAVAF